MKLRINFATGEVAYVPSPPKRRWFRRWWLISDRPFVDNHYGPYLLKSSARECIRWMPPGWYTIEKI